MAATEYGFYCDGKLDRLCWPVFLDVNIISWGYLVIRLSMVYIVTFSCVNIQVQVQIYFQNQSVNRIEFSINLSYNTFTNKSNNIASMTM